MGVGGAGHSSVYLCSPGSKHQNSPGSENSIVGVKMSQWFAFDLLTWWTVFKRQLCHTPQLTDTHCNPNIYSFIIYLFNWGRGEYIAYLIWTYVQYRTVPLYFTVAGPRPSIGCWLTSSSSIQMSAPKLPLQWVDWATRWWLRQSLSHSPLLWTEAEARASGSFPASWSRPGPQWRQARGRTPPTTSPARPSPCAADSSHHLKLTVVMSVCIVIFSCNLH